MKIKSEIIFIIILLNVNFSLLYSQLHTLPDKNSAGEKGTYNLTIPAAYTFSMNYDFNNDGVNEVIKGVMLNKINENTFWVRNAEIKNVSNEVLVKLGKKIFVNNDPLISQIPALYGYIIEILPNKILVSIANEKGESNSDEIVINIRNIKQ